jgi:hypothetical protein
MNFKGVSGMNKVILFLSLMVLPVSAMALTAVSDEALSQVTGQSGVSINVNVTMDQTINTVAWGDSDGLGSSSGTTAGYVGIRNLNMTGMTISSQDTLGASFQPITIDVGTGNPLSDVAGVNLTGITFVHAGLGTLKIGMSGQTIGVALGSAIGTNGDGLNQILGQSYMDLTSMEFAPSSYVNIWAGNNASGSGTVTSGCGVNQTMRLSITDFNLSTQSWGDTDGLGTGSTAGYEGLRGLDLCSADHPITMKGTVSFNCGTKTLGTGTPTVSHIEFTMEDFVAHIDGPITGEQVLSTAKELTGNQVLGNIYISSFDNTIKKGSYIDIYAH